MRDAESPKYDAGQVLFIAEYHNTASDRWPGSKDKTARAKLNDDPAARMPLSAEIVQKYQDLMTSSADYRYKVATVPGPCKQWGVPPESKQEEWLDQTMKMIYEMCRDARFVCPHLHGFRAQTARCIAHQYHRFIDAKNDLKLVWEAEMADYISLAHARYWTRSRLDTQVTSSSAIYGANIL